MKQISEPVKVYIDFYISLIKGEKNSVQRNTYIQMCLSAIMVLTMENYNTTELNNEINKLIN